MNRAH